MIASTISLASEFTESMGSLFYLFISTWTNGFHGAVNMTKLPICHGGVVSRLDHKIKVT